MQRDPRAFAVGLEQDLEADVTRKPRSRLAVKPLCFVSPLESTRRVPADYPLVDLRPLSAPVPVNTVQAAISLAVEGLGCLSKGQPLGQTLDAGDHLPDGLTRCC